jgi:hypothetical protein
MHTGGESAAGHVRRQRIHRPWPVTGLARPGGDRRLATFQQRRQQLDLQILRTAHAGDHDARLKQPFPKRPLSGLRTHVAVHQLAVAPSRCPRRSPACPGRRTGTRPPGGRSSPASSKRAPTQAWPATSARPRLTWHGGQQGTAPQAHRTLKANSGSSSTSSPAPQPDTSVGNAHTAAPGNWAPASRPVRAAGGVYTGRRRAWRGREGARDGGSRSSVTGPGRRCRGVPGAGRVSPAGTAGAPLDARVLRRRRGRRAGDDAGCLARHRRLHELLPDHAFL